MKVQIKDYQAIKNATLEFVPGVNVIVGSTNNGKSSIIRAIQGAINNQGGSGFINYDAGQTEVTVTNNSDKLIWTKSKKQGKSSYNINGVELTKIGQKQLPEVASLLNMHEVEVGTERFQINFWKQMDKPFLVDRTAYQLFDFISQSREQEFVVGLQNTASNEYKQLNSDVNKTNTQIDTITTQLTTLHSDIEILSKVEELDLSRLEGALTISNALTQNITSYNESKANIKKYNTALNKYKININALEKIISETETASTLATKLQNLINNYYTSYKYAEKTKIDFVAIEQSIKNKGIISTKLKEYIKDIERLETNYEKLQSILNQYNNKSVECSKYITQLKDINKKIKGAEVELSKFEVCPLCGNTLNEIHRH